MKITRISDLLNESNIDIKGLDSKTKSGKLKGDVLIDKLKNDEPIKFFKKGTVIDSDVINDDEIISNITNDEGGYDSDKSINFFKKNGRYTDVIETDVDDYQLNQIVKTSDFGGGKGTSLGSAGTIDVESIQCLFLSMYQENRSDNFINTQSNIDKYLTHIKIPIKITSDLIDNNKKWMTTWTKTPQALFEKRVKVSPGRKVDNILSRSKKYVFYHIGYGSGVNKILHTKYKSFKEVKGINISKWSPSDIWAVELVKEEEIYNRVNNCKTIIELNELVDDLFNLKEMVGISLKMISKEVTLIINKETSAPIYEYKGLSLSDDLESNHGLDLVARCHSDIYRDGIEKMTLRTFTRGGLSDMTGEVKGSTAQFGKISLSVINKIISSVGIEDLVPTKNDIKDVSDDELMSDINRMYEHLIDLHGSHKSRSKKDLFDRRRMIIKYQSLYLGCILEENKDNINNNSDCISDIIIQKMFYYALAIKNSVFECPKYVRVM